MRASMNRFALASLCLIACKSAEKAAPEDAAVRPAASTNAVTADAAAPPKPKAKAEPNLLDLVPSVVAVSSAVHNPHDFPEHLVDGRVDTAWNGKTGDLVGGWIAFRVPKDARVRRIEMTAGYDKVKGGVDLFTANHRITKVALYRDGTKLGEHALDPNVRTAQPIAVDGPGGDYKIEVLATLPGSKPEWRELVVSELRVVGDPGKERRAAKDPVRVRVGGLDNEPEKIHVQDVDASQLVGPERGIAELCNAYLRSVAAQKASLEEQARVYDLALHGPSCKEAPAPVSFKPDATYKRVFALRVDNGLMAATHLGVEVPRGVVMLPLAWAWDDPLDPGCPSIVRLRGLKSVRVENGHLVAVTDGERYLFDDQGKGYAASVVGAFFCKEADGKLVCHDYDAQYNPSLGAFAIAPDGTLRMQD